VVAPKSWSVEWCDVPGDIRAADDLAQVIRCGRAALSVAATDVGGAAYAGGGAADRVFANGRVGARRTSAAGAGRGIRTGLPRRTADAAARLPCRATNIVHTNGIISAANIVTAGVERSTTDSAAEMSWWETAVSIAVASSSTAAHAIAYWLVWRATDHAILANLVGRTAGTAAGNWLYA
jgi:hypothetical protein